jgi:hypothetical protein
MVIATAVASIGLVADAEGLRYASPAVFVLAFAASAVLLLLSGRSFLDPRLLRLVYLQISGVGPLLIGFIVPPSDSIRHGEEAIRTGAGAGRSGPDRYPAAGVVTWGCRHAARAGDRICSRGRDPSIGRFLEQEVSTRRSMCRRSGAGTAAVRQRPGNALPAGSGGLALPGTLGATMIDYLFKAEAAAAFGRGENLLRFRRHYAVTSLITVLQASVMRRWAPAEPHDFSRASWRRDLLAAPARECR